VARKRSAETELRETKRELRELKAELHERKMAFESKLRAWVAEVEHRHRSTGRFCVYCTDYSSVPWPFDAARGAAAVKAVLDRIDGTTGGSSYQVVVGILAAGAAALEGK
jgi:hypothetical protein